MHCEALQMRRSVGDRRAFPRTPLATQAPEHAAPGRTPHRGAAAAGDLAGTPPRVLAWTPMRTYSSLNPNPSARTGSPASAKRARPADAGAGADADGGAAGGTRPGGAGTPLLGAGLVPGGSDRRLRQRLADSTERRVWQVRGMCY